MKQLETLLTSLIQRGWEPWNRKADFCEYRFWKIRFIKESGEIVGIYTLRSLVSLESGLWQFVCENEFIKNTEALPDTICGWYIDWDTWYDTIANQDNYEFRLLESSLIPEEELGKFLLSNIVIEWNSKYETK